jgi:hypothetical protein
MSGILRGLSEEQAEAEAATIMYGMEQGYRLRQAQKEQEEYNIRRAEAKRNAQTAIIGGTKQGGESTVTAAKGAA